ncbi:hypothetical protein PG984_008101 [Apiospora sp. TS-2023a]
MSGNNNNNTPKPSGSPPLGAPTAPRAMREQAARAAASGRGRIRVALPIVPPAGQPPNPNPPRPPPNQYPFGETGDSDGRSGSAVVFGVAEGSDTRVRHPNAEAYPPHGMQHHCPPRPRADANMGRRVSSDGAAYPPNQDNRRVLQGFNPERMDRRGPAEVAHDHVIASRRRSQEIIAQRAAEQQRLEQEQRNLNASFAARQREREAQKAAREQAARIEKARDQFEKGRDFEDDDDFFPGHRRNGGSIQCYKGRR